MLILSAVADRDIGGFIFNFQIMPGSAMDVLRFPVKAFLFTVYIRLDRCYTVPFKVVQW